MITAREKAFIKKLNQQSENLIVLLMHAVVDFRQKHDQGIPIKIALAIPVQQWYYQSIANMETWRVPVHTLFQPNNIIWVSYLPWDNGSMAYIIGDNNSVYTI